MTNVTPGDMAVVVDPYAEPGRGAIVNVVRAAVPGETIRDVSGASIYDPADSRPAWAVEGFVRGSCGHVRGPLLIIYDSCLRRIPPDVARDAHSEERRFQPPVPADPLMDFVEHLEHAGIRVVKVIRRGGARQS